MRIVLFGKNGQVGWELAQILPPLGDVYSFGRQELDVSNLEQVRNALLELKPELIINASAYTEVDRAEKEPQKASRINAEAPGVMAETARQLNAVFLHYSTDYVFDGTHTAPYTETDTANPINHYGKSKLEGERNIAQAGGAHLILRTSWVYSLRGNTFVKKLLAWARTNETLRVVDDQTSNPTWARDLAETTVSLVTANRAHLQDAIKERSGIYHMAGTGYASRYEWAQEILALASHRTEILTYTLQPVSSLEFPLPAARPAFSALDCAKLNGTFHLQLPQWRDSLKLAMANL